MNNVSFLKIVFIASVQVGRKAPLSVMEVIKNKHKILHCFAKQSTELQFLKSSKLVELRTSEGKGGS
jgi:hypothetical protein